MADILVVCAGKPALITKEMVKPGVIVVDVGINRITRELDGLLPWQQLLAGLICL